MTLLGPAACRVAALAALLASLVVANAPVAAQSPPAARRSPQLELRADVIAGRATTVQVALGLGAALGNYARAGVVVGAGTTSVAGARVASGRADAVVRFLLDPFREQRWGPYGGAGLSALYTAGAAGGGGRAWRGSLLAVAGLEGRSTRGFLPAIEVGLGGGTRVGLVLRRTPAVGR